MILGVIVQQPTEFLDYDLEFNEWFEGVDDNVVSSVTNVVQTTGTGGTLSANPLKAADDIMKIWISGGADGEVYTVEVTTTTAAGRIKQDELEVQIREFV